MKRFSFQIGFFIAAIAAPLLFVIIPISSFFGMSFWGVDGGAVVRTRSLDNYREFFANSAYWGTYLATLVLCLKVSLFGIMVGYPVAYFIWGVSPKYRYVLIILLILPLFMSYIVKIYTMRTILGVNGLLNDILLAVGIIDQPSRDFIYNQNAILITMSVIFLPFIVVPIFLSLERIPRDLISASSDLGASALQTVMRIVAPLSLPGTLTGALFAFVLALGDFVTPQMVGGPNGFTFGRVIWSQFGLAFNWPFGSALAVILFMSALATIAVAGWAVKRARL